MHPRRTGAPMQLLVVGPPNHMPPGDAANVARDIGWQVRSATNYRDAIDAARHGAIDAVVITPFEPDVATAADEQALTDLIRIVEDKRITGLMLGETKRKGSTSSTSLLSAIGPEVSPDELRGRLAMIEKFHATFRKLDAEMADMHRLGEQLKSHFSEVEQQMQLAGRLQRDFLPDLSQPIQNIRFVSSYLPASWVSGDIFNVFKVDSRHTGFYIADAVGHGMAASLLTMFINRSLAPPQRHGLDASTWDPSLSIAALNEALLTHALPNCQFVTAWFGLLDHETLILRYARGGHPYPMHILADGTVQELKSSGGLLGVFDTNAFPCEEVQLRVGERILLFTDGVEFMFSEEQTPNITGVPLASFVQRHADVGIGELLKELEAQAGHGQDDNLPKDDITFLGLEVLN